MSNVKNKITNFVDLIIGNDVNVNIAKENKEEEAILVWTLGIMNIKECLTELLSESL